MLEIIPYHYKQPQQQNTNKWQKHTQIVQNSYLADKSKSLTSLQIHVVHFTIFDIS